MKYTEEEHRSMQHKEAVERLNVEVANLEHRQRLGELAAAQNRKVRTTVRMNRRTDRQWYGPRYAKLNWDRITG